MLETARNFTIVGVAALVIATSAAAEEPHPIVLEIYEGFQRGQLDRWDSVIDENVVTNSSARFGTTGLDALKAWANEFVVAFAPRIDLVDYINAIDDNGDGRAVMTVNLNWRHVKPFFGVLQPTGRTGTSIENLIMTSSICTRTGGSFHKMCVPFPSSGESIEQSRSQ